MFIKKNRYLKLLLKIIGLFAVGVLTPFTFSLPVNSAEKIYFIYDPIKEYLKVSSLEAFVQNGTIDQNLAFYLDIAGVSEQETVLLREALTKKIDIDPVVISRVLNSDKGKSLLEFLGRIINIQGGRNGKFALRGAIITAALDDQGLTLLNFLRQLPVDMQINVQKAIAFAKDIDIIVRGTELFVKKVAQLSAQEAQQSAKIDFSQLPD